MDVIVVVVVIYTLLQGTTLPWVARKLGVLGPGAATEIQIEAAPLDEMHAHVLQVRIRDDSRMHGVYLAQLRLPQARWWRWWCGTATPVATDTATRLQTGDQMLVVTPEKVRAATEHRLRAVARGGRAGPVVRRG